MVNTYINSAFDWSKDKSVAVKERGSAAILATLTFKNGQMVNALGNRQRCVWPSTFETNNSRIISRRILAK